MLLRLKIWEKYVFISKIIKLLLGYPFPVWRIPKIMVSKAPGTAVQKWMINLLLDLRCIVDLTLKKGEIKAISLLWNEKRTQLHWRLVQNLYWPLLNKFMLFFSPFCVLAEQIWKFCTLCAQISFKSSRFKFPPTWKCPLTLEDSNFSFFCNESQHL